MRRIAAVILLAALLPACGESTPASTSSPPPTGDVFTVDLHPTFVQGVIPGAPTGVLVTVASTDATPVTLTASAEGAAVTVDPDSIAPGQVAEVVVVVDPATEERPIEILVTATRGGTSVTASKTTSVMPWEDDRGDEARNLLSVFLPWLAEERPDLGITPATPFQGSMVAPGLLVVSHYLFLSEDWEVGLSWHVMIPPDDWAEIYLRPRGELAPSLAFRLASQDAAANGTVEISEVDPPTEIVR